MLKDEIKAQEEKIRQQSFGKRFSYFWYYQWKKILLGVCILAVLIYILFHMYLYRNGSYLYVVMANVRPGASGSITLLTDYLKDRNVDDSDAPSVLTDNMVMPEDQVSTLALSYSEKLQVLMENGDSDVLISDKWIIDDFASQALLCNLEKTLPPDLLQKVKDHLYYYTYPSGERIAVAFRADSFPKVREQYDEKTRPLVGICSKSTHQDRAADFAAFLTE